MPRIISSVCSDDTSLTLACRSSVFFLSHASSTLSSSICSSICSDASANFLFYSSNRQYSSFGDILFYSSNRHNSSFGDMPKLLCPLLRALDMLKCCGSFPFLLPFALHSFSRGELSRLFPARWRLTSWLPLGAIS